MILLVPSWARDYPEYWNTIRRRNLWFIKIRYLAILILSFFLLTGQYLLSFKFDSTQVIAIASIATSMLIYNVAFQIFRPRIGDVPDQFNAMHFSLVQMIMDLTALMLLVYFTGTLESPLYVFFIIHMVIGSLILPNYLVYIICSIVIFTYTLLIYLQNMDVISTHVITGIIPLMDRPWTYDLLFILIFSAMMITTVLIANRIAGNLLLREEELRQTLLKLDEAEKSKQKYLMGVVHEIKTPFSAIKSITELILQNYLGPVEEPIKNKIFRIRERTSEGLSLINNILKISKLKLLEKTEYSKVFPGEIIETYLQDHTDNLKNKNITIKFEDKRKLRRPIHGDEALIKMAFSNIISNAEKYVDVNGTVHITIDYEDEYVRIKIMDTGIGIPANDQGKIFNQFYRATNTRKHNSEGSGLGLSVVKEIIDHHRGSIRVESPSEIGTEKQPGTTFIIKLPYMIEAEPEAITLTPLDGGL